MGRPARAVRAGQDPVLALPPHARVQTVRFKNELERNITIKLGYANAKIYQCDSPQCPRLGAFR